MATRHLIWRRIRRIWIATGITATVVFVIWSLVAYRASAEAQAASRSDTTVGVSATDGVWRFATLGSRPERPAALVFLPGALVDPRAYAPLARAAAQAGFPAFIVELPRRGAFGGADTPELDDRVHRLVDQLDERTAVVVAGHSRGAVVASRLASQSVPRLGGLVIIGSTHPRDVDLSALQVPVTKIVATRDGLAAPSEVRQNAGRLPAHTRWVWIEGGNHSQFGWYGFQPGDRFATVDASVQRAQMTTAVLQALEEAEAGQRPVR